MEELGMMEEGKHPPRFDHTYDLPDGDKKTFGLEDDELSLALSVLAGKSVKYSVIDRLMDVDDVMEDDAEFLAFNKLFPPSYSDISPPSSFRKSTAAANGVFNAAQEGSPDGEDGDKKMPPLDEMEDDAEFLAFNKLFPPSYSDISPPSSFRKTTAAANVGQVAAQESSPDGEDGDKKMPPLDDEELAAMSADPCDSALDFASKFPRTLGSHAEFQDFARKFPRTHLDPQTHLDVGNQNRTPTLSASAAAQAYTYSAGDQKILATRNNIQPGDKKIASAIFPAPTAEQDVHPERPDGDRELSAREKSISASARTHPTRNRAATPAVSVRKTSLVDFSL
eukprot:CAMPEP_0194349528 /NCGR_PEP_ID=MMETSP0171-20130528/107139_1 /TAXON_ID=218684 /ORGANISM="Corethron pennatum, Strain L29A3" /LENGTH=337 /DNA_ID=CAMNT_0039116989 /DNA_START=50 /DNA_END=1059 /DNA_ORIENTATION=-